MRSETSFIYRGLMMTIAKKKKAFDFHYFVLNKLDYNHERINNKFKNFRP